MKIFLPLLDNGNGQVMAEFMIDFFHAFRYRDVELARASDSHANRGMNKIANDFLASDCEAWVNLDADMHFRPADVANLLSHPDLLLVYGIYPKKEDATNPCFGTFDDAPPTGDPNLAVVRRCGRGFMLVRRELLEKMKEDNGGPALRYHNHGRVEWDFFPSGLVTGSMSFIGSTKSNPKPEEIIFPKDDDNYLKREWISEDWYFCERARALGVPTLVDPRIALGHIGSKIYYFNPEQVARTDSNIKEYREIFGWMDYENFYKDLAKALRENALAHGSSRFVEVGSFLGRSMAAMHCFLRSADVGAVENVSMPILNVELHAVDTFVGKSENQLHQLYLEAHGGNVEQAFRANMAALNVPAIVHAKPSVEAANDFEDGSCDAIFIDGDHREASVAEDIAAWLPKVKPGGLLSGHDIDEPGVANAVNAFSIKSNLRAQVFGRCWYVRIPDMGYTRGDSETGAEAIAQANRKADSITA